MLPALTGPDGMRNITRQNNSETSYDTDIKKYAEQKNGIVWTF